MFANIGWVEILILLVTGLFVFGPERLPEAASWLGKAVRQVRDYATGAREQLRSELGPEYDQLRKPLEDLRGLRDFNPKRSVTKYLFDDEQDHQQDTAKPNGHPAATPPTSTQQAQSGDGLAPLKPGERAPIDPDAT